MSVSIYCQNGSTQATKPEYPKRVMYEEVWVTLFTDTLVKKLTDFRINYRECLANNVSITTELRVANELIESQRFENVTLRTQAFKYTLLTKGKDKEININKEKITSLKRDNKKLRIKGGIMGGLVGALALVVTVLSLK